MQPICSQLGEETKDNNKNWRVRLHLEQFWVWVETGRSLDVFWSHPLPRQGLLEQAPGTTFECLQGKRRTLQHSWQPAPELCCPYIKKCLLMFRGNLWFVTGHQWKEPGSSFSYLCALQDLSWAFSASSSLSLSSCGTCPSPWCCWLFSACNINVKLQFYQ